jgi:hypothetical protein
LISRSRDSPSRKLVDKMNARAGYMAVAAPKVAKFRKTFSELVKA